jgi:hypothetical protein
MLVVVLSAVTFGCSSSNFEVGQGESDSAVDSGTIATDSTTEETAADTGEAPDGTSDTGVMHDSAVGPDSTMFDVGTDEVISVEVGPITDASMTGCTTNAECGASNFCFKTGCGATSTGKCGPLPTGISNYGPVCGCDGVTYWNDFQAATFSVGVRYTGECTSDRLPCSTSSECPTSGECIFRLDGVTACSGGSTGACWRNPSGKICPLGKSGPSVRVCGSGLCTNQCEAVKSKQRFYVEPCTL